MSLSGSIIPNLENGLITDMIRLSSGKPNRRQEAPRSRAIFNLDGAVGPTYSAVKSYDGVKNDVRPNDSTS